MWVCLFLTFFYFHAWIYISAKFVSLREFMFLCVLCWSEIERVCILLCWSVCENLFRSLCNFALLSLVSASFCVSMYLCKFVLLFLYVSCTCIFATASMPAREFVCLPKRLNSYMYKRKNMYTTTCQHPWMKSFISIRIIKEAKKTPQQQQKNKKHTHKNPVPFLWETVCNVRLVHYWYLVLTTVFQSWKVFTAGRNVPYF